VNTQQYLAGLPRIVFFTGKGGVGKTSLACATGIALADEGKRVLLVSTDPASNLDEVLGTRLSGDPTPIVGAERLFGLNIDPIAAAKAHREEVMRPYRGVLPDASLAGMEEQLSGACTVEIAAFNEFTKLLADADTTAAFDHIIFDTAPTGHTLRLLNLPAAWTTFIQANTTGTSCLGPLQGLQAQRSLYEASLRNLANASLTRVVLVSRPERSALREADRTHTELKLMGISNQILVLNGVFVPQGGADPIARALEKRGKAAISEITPEFATLPRFDVPLLSSSPLGIEKLRRVLSDQSPISSGGSGSGKDTSDLGPPLAALTDEIEAAGPGVILIMGKGGVGKTTIASAIALELARRGHPVHLTTTDPAGNVLNTLNGEFPSLRVTRIDPETEKERYSAEIRAQAAPLLDDQGLALLDEDLRSPCTEEIAVFRAFAETVAEGESQFVVIDTAPTGHTILLLDAAEAYHREVSRSTSQLPQAIRSLLGRLRDPCFCRVILVALPEATPVHEAEQLQQDLKRAGISPFAWVVNQSFAVHSLVDPVLRQRQSQELPYINHVRERLAQRFALLPWKPSEPVGTDQLLRLVTRTASPPYANSPKIPAN
jgi:arsenite-transporting ATPase